MCSPNIPPAPAAPDYAAANREGIMTDIETLPLRRKIEAQARLGQGDFAGLGDADLAAQLFQQQLQFAPQAAQGLLDLQRQYGVDFANESRRQLEATDPEGFRLRQQFGDRLLNGRDSIESLVGGIDAPTFEQVGNGPRFQNLRGGPALQEAAAAAGLSSGSPLQRLDTSGVVGQYANLLRGAKPLDRMGDAAAMERMGAAANYADRGATAAGRSMLEQQTMDELAKVGTLDPVLQRAAEQAARARGAASGNILGDGAALQEALGVQLAMRDQDNQRRSNALGFLQSGQSTSDTANRLAEANMNAQGQVIGQRNQAAQADADNMARRLGFNNAAALQEFQNANSAISNAFNAQLQGAQFNNAAQQQDLVNANSATQGNFENQLARLGFNNSARQQGFQNQQATTAFNNQNAQQGFANSLEAIAQRNTAKQQQFAGQQQTAAMRQGARQQDLANVQSFLGLQPIVSQGGQLAGLQQGAAPFVSGGYSGTLLNPNAGAQGANFAAQNFGTQANIFGTQANFATANSFANNFGDIAKGISSLGSGYSSFRKG